MRRDLPRYVLEQSYDWNYDHPPTPTNADIPQLDRTWRFLNWDLESPLGIAAGPLLNGDWILYYASLGFDFLTYKTVRSRERACYEAPNLLPVDTAQMDGQEQRVTASSTMRGSWAVSYGMPSKSPDHWRADVERTRDRLPKEKVLSVSVVATVQSGWSMSQVAEDYARCAEWAISAGADCVETNFSCPNVSTCDGQIYTQPNDAALIAEVVKQRIGDVPLLVKIGHFRDTTAIAPLVMAIAPHVDAIVSTNSVTAQVQTADGKLYFNGQKRGICGAATLNASVAQVQQLVQVLDSHSTNVAVVGVGGIENANGVRQYLKAGAATVQLATSVMTNPLVGCEIRKSMAADPWPPAVDH